MTANGRVGNPPVTAGQLLILASGPSGAEPVVRPVFSAIGRKTVWLGQAERLTLERQ